MQNLEQTEQIRLISWCEIASKRDPRIGRIFHVPNGGKRGAIEAGKFRLMGVRAGVPDLFLPVPNDIGEHGLWIEMKSPKGRPTDKQVGWHTFLKGQGYRVEVCRSWVEGAQIICAYLGYPQKGWL